MSLHRVLPAVVGLFAFSGMAHAAAIDWAQPPVACIEEVVPQMPNRPCLDLSTVTDPAKDLPANMSQDEMTYWALAKAPLAYCRADEILRREAAQPGTFSAGKIEVSWMQIQATQHSAEKVSAVYEASRANQLPAHVLTGALYQESMFSDLGIAEDGGNYSCGIGQVNISEWCNWASTAAPEKKKLIGWPKTAINCSILDPELLKPFYDIAKTRLNGEPEYKLNKTHFSAIAYKDVVAGFPNASPAVQQQRYALVQEFIGNCSNVREGVAAKAKALALLYKNYVPAGLKQINMYPTGQKFQRKCQDEGYTGAYPLNLGWLLAVGSYNSGPRAVDALAYYNGWDANDLKDPATFKNMWVGDLVNSFYWVGSYNKEN